MNRKQLYIVPVFIFCGLNAMDQKSPSRPKPFDSNHITLEKLKAFYKRRNEDIAAEQQRKKAVEREFDLATYVQSDFEFDASSQSE